jgi:anti-sigma regulatory factor (Ser/Thr protein kinase)
MPTHVVFPAQVTGGSLHNVWSSIPGLESPLAIRRIDAAVDLTNVEYVDPEGLNYLALVPAFLAETGARVRISLPRSGPVRSVIRTSGILEHIVQRYDSLLVTENLQPVKNFADAPEDSLISLALRSYVFEPENVDGIFRQDIIHNLLRNQLFYASHLLQAGCCTAISELVHNVFEHSERRIGCVTMHIARDPMHRDGANSGHIVVAVSDLGIGIPTSLAQRAEYDFGGQFDGFHDWEYLEFALSYGASRFGPHLRGLGLPTVVARATTTRVSSGRGMYQVHARRGRRGKVTAFLPGTSLHVTFDIQDTMREGPTDDRQAGKDNRPVTAHEKASSGAPPVEAFAYPSRSAPVPSGASDTNTRC